MRRYARILAFISLGACGDSTAPVAGDLVLNRQRWADRAITSYDFELVSANEWFAPRTYVISVRGGIVTRMVNKADGAEVPLTASSQQLSIDGLFERALELQKEANDDSKLQFEVRFDPILNYVRFLSADHTDWADDSYSYSASNLVR